MAFTDLRFAGRYTAIKSVVLGIVMAGALAANPGFLKPKPPVVVALSTKKAALGESVVVSLTGVANSSGIIRLVSDYGNSIDEMPYALDNAGREKIELNPRYAGSIEVLAVAANGTASNSESLLVMEGQAVPKSSIFVFGPKSGATVGEQVYVRGKANPGTVVVVAPSRGESSRLTADATGEWGGVFNLKPGSQTITVAEGVNNGPRVEIPVKVQ